MLKECLEVTPLTTSPVVALAELFPVKKTQIKNGIKMEYLVHLEIIR